VIASIVSITEYVDLKANEKMSVRLLWHLIFVLATATECILSLVFVKRPLPQFTSLGQ